MARGKRHLEIWTIGHSVHPLDEFVALLKEYDIEVLADVRRYPGSRRHPQYNLPGFSEALEEAGIKYLSLPELGGRRRPRVDSPNTNWRNAMFRGYADHMDSEEFREGIRKLENLAKNVKVCVMCAEVLWWRCHRALISDLLKSQGHLVWHILGPGKVQEHPYTSAARIVGGQLSYAAGGAPRAARRQTATGR